MVDTLVQSSGPHVQGPWQSRSAAEVLEVSEMARVCWRGLVGFGNMQYSLHFNSSPDCIHMSQG
jgi:hypothetical protein